MFTKKGLALLFLTTGPSRFRSPFDLFWSYAVLDPSLPPAPTRTFPAAPVALFRDYQRLASALSQIL